MFQSLKSVRLVLRTLIRERHFSIPAVATLTLAMAFCLVVFSIYSAFQLTGLPFRAADALVEVSEPEWSGGEAAAPAAHYLEWARLSERLVSVAAYSRGYRTITEGEAERLELLRASPKFMETLGVVVGVGRHFGVGDYEPGAAPVVLVSHDLWVRRFESRPPGDWTVSLDGRSYHVLGVLPRSFRFLFPVDVMVPLALETETELAGKQVTTVRVLARKETGSTSPDVAAELEAIRGLYESTKQKPSPRLKAPIRVEGLQDAFMEGTAATLNLLLLSVGLVIVLAAANVSVLLLSRNASKEIEFALRRSLGARGRHLVGRVLGESVAIAVCAAVLALLATLAVLAMFGPSLARGLFGELAGLVDVSVNRWVVGFVLVVPWVVGLLLGAGPAGQLFASSRTGLADDKRVTATRSTAIRGATVVQVALAVTLLFAAGLLLRSMVKVVTVPLGYQAERLMTLRVNLPLAKYSSRGLWEAFHVRLIEKLETIPGVTSVGATNHLPTLGSSFSGGVLVPSGASAAELGTEETMVSSVNAGFFRTMGIPVIRGRVFSEADGAEGQPVVVLSQSLAARLFGSADPLGREVSIPGRHKQPPIVVGIVGDTRHAGPMADWTRQAYVPLRQQVWPSMAFVLRMTGSWDVGLAVRRLVRELDPTLAAFDIRTQADRLGVLLLPRRVVLFLVSALAVVALVLVGVGVYGAVAHGVALQRREIGVRVALGGLPSDVALLYVRRAMSPAWLGLGVGLIASWLGGGWLQEMVFGVPTFDLPTAAAAGLVLSLVVAVAALFPAWLVARTEPARVLR
jgi:putative ABC transport system permease protein